jgi:N-methylhydantoinase A
MSELDSHGFRQAFDGLAAAAVAALESEGFARADITIHHYADLRYVGQAFELTVPVDAAAPPDLQLMAKAFHEEHFRTYAHKADNEPVENVNIRVIAKVATPPLPVKSAAASIQSLAATSYRDVYFGPVWGNRLTPVLQRADLVGSSRAGPVIVEEYDATCVVPPDATVQVDARSNLIIEMEI